MPCPSRLPTGNRKLFPFSNVASACVLLVESRRCRHGRLPLDSSHSEKLASYFETFIICMTAHVSRLSDPYKECCFLAGRAFSAMFMWEVASLAVLTAGV